MKIATFCMTMLVLAGCSDPTEVGARSEAEMIEKSRADAAQIRDAERLIRSLNDERTPEGRKRIEEAANLTASAERMADTVANVTGHQAIDDARR